MATESARLSPRVTRCNGSGSPDQGNPRNNNEQSLHILVEPQRDGLMNMITLVSPVSGQIYSQYIAENGACIVIQPGFIFRVPFPQEHNIAAPYPPQQFQQVQYVPNAGPYGVQVPGNMYMPRGLSAPVENLNPSCRIHGSPNSVNGFPQSADENRADRRNSQRKTKFQTCTCHPTYNYTMAPNSKPRREPKINGALPVAGEIQTENGVDSSATDGKEADIEIPVLAQPKVTVKDARSVLLSWEDCVVNNSHLAECDFELEISSKGGAFKAIYCGNAVEYLADGLSPATEYTFRLRVVIDGQRGRYSETICAITPSTIPSSPGLPKVTQKTKTSLVIKWSAPYDGGAVITAYSLQWNCGKPDLDFEEVYNGLQKQYKLSHKLPPMTPCRFRLKASNENGWSDFSPVLECMTSASLPDAPDAPHLVKATSTSLSLKWTEPKDNGAPITEYRLEMNDELSGYGFKPVYCDDGFKHICTDLLRDTAFKFRLSAKNINGFSKHSQIVSYRTLPKPPGRVDKPHLVGKAKARSFNVSWDPPKDTGGPDIDHYVIEIFDAKDVEHVDVHQDIKTEYSPTGLRPGHTYKLRVFAVGKGGKSEPSLYLQVTTLAILPCKPEAPRQSTRMKLEPTSLNIEWDPPVDDGGSPILNYTLRMGWPIGASEHQDEDVYQGPRRQCTISGLKPGEKYSFQVMATSKAGPSPWSESSELHTAPGPPDAPEFTTCLCKAPTLIHLEWAEPATHGTQVTGYVAEQLIDETFIKVYEGPCTNCDIKKGLLPATFYYFRVQALSNAGPSFHSAVSTVETLPAAPAAVTFLKVLDQTSSSALLQWKHPNDNGANITNYIIEVTGSSSFNVTVPVASRSIDGSECHDDDDNDADGAGSDNYPFDDDISSHLSSHDDEKVKTLPDNRRHDYMEHEVSGLLADTAYRIRVQAVNRIGSSPFSHSIQFVTKELPPNPPSLELLSSSYQTLKLKWGESASPRRNNLGLHFTLQMKSGSGSFSNVFSGMATSFSVSKLKELSAYTFRINATNDAGDGPFSEPKTFYTKAQPPHMVKDLVFKRLLPSSGKLSWQANNSIQADEVLNYIVQRLRSDQSKEFSEVYNGPKTEYIFNDLVPDHEYHFRVCAMRFVGERLRQSAPSTPSCIKGQFSNTLRNRIPVETEEVESKQALSTEDNKEEIKKKEMSDTQVSLLILGGFLFIGIIVSFFAWFFVGEINF